MNEEQYWDCDHCEDRSSLADYNPRKWETIEGKTYLLCGPCYIDANGLIQTKREEQDGSN